MSTTANYGLYIEDDNTVKFQDWREKMNGASNSNMHIIDDAIANIASVLPGKAAAAVAVTATLLSTGWSGSEAPYVQALVIDGMTADHNGIFDIAHSATSEQRAASREAMLVITSQEDGILTIAADGVKPECDIPVFVILLG